MINIPKINIIESTENQILASSPLSGIMLSSGDIIIRKSANKVTEKNVIATAI